MFDIRGRTAFVTGGARGIGLGIARALSKEGAKLALVDLDLPSLHAAEDELGALTEVRTYCLDVTDRSAYAKVAGRVADELGTVTLLFNNAGVADSVSPSRMAYAMWDHVMSVNLNGVYHGIHTFLPGMLSSGQECHIVNTSSEAGHVEGGSGFLYHASKFAVIGLSESLRAELAPNGIGVSVLCPGPVATDIVETSRSMRPESAPTHGRTIQAILASAHDHLRTQGVPPDLVGEIVLDAVRNNLPYVHTRGDQQPAVSQRARAIQESMAYADRFLKAAEEARPTPEIN